MPNWTPATFLRQKRHRRATVNRPGPATTRCPGFPFPHVYPACHPQPRHSGEERTLSGPSGPGGAGSPDSLASGRNGSSFLRNPFRFRPYRSYAGSGSSDGTAFPSRIRARFILSMSIESFSRVEASDRVEETVLLMFPPLVLAPRLFPASHSTPPRRSGEAAPP